MKSALLQCTASSADDMELSHAKLARVPLPREEGRVLKRLQHRTSSLIHSGRHPAAESTNTHDVLHI